MRSDEITVPKPEKWPKKGNKVSLYAYFKALSGKDRHVAQPNLNAGKSGLMKELEKTRLDTCDEA